MAVELALGILTDRLKYQFPNSNGIAVGRYFSRQGTSCTAATRQSYGEKEHQTFGGANTDLKDSPNHRSTPKLNLFIRKKQRERDFPTAYYQDSPVVPS
ncbi:MAG: hypothetical protein IH987_20925 [Planctomycetes bacterium]|nr:hypothetical protein [Planctomycetota bacterium]